MQGQQHLKELKDGEALVSLLALFASGVLTLIALHFGSNIFNMAAKAEEVGWF